MNVKQTPEAIDHLYKSLENPMKPLSQWEVDFIVSTYDQFSRSGTLSVRQFDVLERIYDEKC